MTTEMKPEKSPAVHSAAQSTVQSAEQDYPSPRYAWYVVGVLTFVYIFSFIDRQILNLLLRPIRRDLGISEVEMGYLMGVSFAVFYTFFGILMGRLADSKSRRSLIAIGFVFWSVMTAGCGLAKNFVQMLLMRMGVGVGEATLSPAAYSLITDYFPPNRRATAISVYSMGIYLGSGLALFLGGIVVSYVSDQGAIDLPVIGATRPWQIVFFIVGLPGILLALLMYTVREPVRRGVKMLKTGDGKMKVAQVPLRDAIAYMLENKWTFICHNVGFALLSFSSYGTTAWVPTFFYRNHGWTEARAGMIYGGIVAIFGTLGIVAGGRFADWLADRGYKDATMRVGLLAAIAWFPTGILYPLVSDPYVAAALLAPTVFLASAPFGVAPAAIQQMMPNIMRGQASSIYLFVVNLIGLGVGPIAVAYFTERVFGYEESVRYSLLIVTNIAHIAAAVLLWLSLKPFLRSLDHLKRWTAANL